MPAFPTHAAQPTVRRQAGLGGKPPSEPRPTGGGGGGGDDDGRGEGRGPREWLHRVRLFLFSFLAGDMLFFALMVVIFFARQTGTRMDPRTHEQIGDWRPVLLPPILYLNTAVLLLSGLTMETARRHIFREFDVLEEWLGLGRPALRHALAWVGVTFVLGVLFLAGQWMAWAQLTAQGFGIGRDATPASNFFYILTGLHAAHLVLGVAVLALCMALLGLLGRVEFRQIAVDLVAWYWHAMGVAWLVLFGVLVLGQ
ncbi:MAG: cytochrome c oxidase subunit 3 [Terracidiphilus sp.]